MEFINLPKQGNNILKSFGIEDNNIEKAKKFLIGQLDKSGKNVKTADGWKPVSTHGHLQTHHHSGEPVVTANQTKIDFDKTGEKIKGGVITHKYNPKQSGKKWKVWGDSDNGEGNGIVGIGTSYKEAVKDLENHLSYYVTTEKEEKTPKKKSQVKPEAKQKPTKRFNTQDELLENFNQHFSNSPNVSTMANENKKPLK